jgi:phospholipid/cholesterol/gamma-HCH transport system substrate-binding protein
MLTRAVRARLAIFALLSVLILAITSVFYIRLPQLLGFEQYTVTADFADASGLYSNAIVTYRGAQVGKVGAIALRPDGVTVTLNIDDGTSIPANSTATIHSTSAIGEQYVDLVPRASGGGDLHDGSTIPRARTVGLPKTDVLMNKLDALLRSIPRGPLRRSINDLATSFAGSGPDLQRLLDSASVLLDAAHANFGPTRNLINDLGPFLTTQQDLGGQTTSTVTNLASFTHQLVLSNSDIVSLLREVPPLATQVKGVEQDLSPSLNLLLANLTSTGQITDVYVPALKQVLTVYPALVADLIAFAQPTAATGKIPLYFHLNADDPPECTKGFLPPDKRRDPAFTRPIDTPSPLYCKEAKSAPPSVRGARNLPCLNNPGVRAATPAACLGLPEARNASSAAPAAVPYAPTTGKVYPPSGAPYVVGDVSSGKEKMTWQQLWLRPIGR